VLVAAVPFGEGDLVAALFTEEHGVFRGLAKGGQSRARVATWQVGNLLEARWVARLSDQLGSVTAELIHPAAALAMSDAWALAALSAACAVAAGALQERVPMPAVFRGLLHLVALASAGQPVVGELVRWEVGLLRELGFGLDLRQCALTGATSGLAYVSPKSGRAVCAEAAAPWQEKLLPLPAFLTGESAGDAAQWRAGLRLTGHFLARDVFGGRNLPLPAARVLLAERAV
jgi:DNA repair protein RecO (recombination protein O)